MNKEKDTVFNKSGAQFSKHLIQAEDDEKKERKRTNIYLYDD